MGTETGVLHMLFFPFMAPGHIIPMMDMAKLFAARGVRVTFLTTPANAPLVQGPVDRANESTWHPIQLTLIQFPSAAAGLPEGCENVATIPSPDHPPNFIKGLAMLRQPFDQVLRELLPDYVVTDSFMPWTLDVATKLGIPRIEFNGTGFFALCATESVNKCNPCESLPEDVDSFILPGLPHRIEMLKSQIFPVEKVWPAFVELLKNMKEAEARSYGMVVNSFYKLEPDYAEHYRKVVGRRAWAVGPVSLCNEDVVDQSGRGEKASIDQNGCLNWLDNKRRGSVVYVCFGSLWEFPHVQLREIALALEASGHPIIWVVKGGDSSNEFEWLPEGYEERMGDQVLIVRGWAPQILILNHPAVGGFVTHCGWNSTLEGISAGVPMTSWPLSAEQFYNERLIVDVVRIGVPIGIKENNLSPSDQPLVKAAQIEMAVARMMNSGEEAQAMRKRAEELAETAKRAMDEGGSSYISMGNLIQELLDRRSAAESL